jgi:hypothetical protein
MPALWALGWTVTTLAGIQVGEQFTVFGSTGALTVSALLGLLLQRLVPTGLGVTATPVARALAETRATYAVVAGRGAGNAR